MGEKAVLIVQAHVFQIDPETKKKWLPSSTSSVRVAYYHDPSRKTYRIIAIEGGKPLINSTVTANMTFTKTSPKFGQWSDHRANTVYGLGFSSEKDLSQFSDKFTEAKTAARILLEERKRNKTTTTTAATTTTTTTTTTTKDQSSSNDGNGSGKDDISSMESPSESPSSTAVLTPSTSSSDSTTTTTTTTSGTASVQSTINSPTSTSTTKPSTNGSDAEQLDLSTADKQANQQIESLKFENNKLKVALASSAQNVKKWESEMQTLRNNNTMLTTALEESTQHVAEWKRQLQKYKEECDALRKKVNEIDGNSKNTAEFESIKQENEELKEVLSAVQIDLEQKTGECNKKDALLSELNEKVKALNSENEAMSAKMKQKDTTIAKQEDTHRKKFSMLQQKHKEIESQLKSTLTLHKELMDQFSS